MNLRMAIMICVAMTFAVPDTPALSRRASCQNNLKQLGLNFMMYADEHKEVYPTLAATPGKLMFDAAAIYPEYLPDWSILTCPGDENDRRRDFEWIQESLATIDAQTDLTQERKEQAHADALSRYIDDYDYIYLGYQLEDRAAGITFIRTYARAVLDGVSVDQALQATFRGLTLVGDTGDTEKPRYPILIERLGHHSPATKFHVLETTGVRVLNLNRLDLERVLSKEFVLGFNMLAELDELPPEERQERLEMLANYGR